MTFLLGILMLPSLQQKDSIALKYYQHSQSCHLWWTTDYFWNLSLSNQNTFILIETSRDSRSWQLGVSQVKKNTYSTKPVIVSGTWEQTHDTITLNQITTTTNFNDLAAKKIEFLATRDGLKKLYSDGIENFPNIMGIKPN